MKRRMNSLRMRVIILLEENNAYAIVVYTYKHEDKVLLITKF